MTAILQIFAPSTFGVQVLTIYSAFLEAGRASCSPLVSASVELLTASWRAFYGRHSSYAK